MKKLLKQLMITVALAVALILHLAQAHAAEPIIPVLEKDGGSLIHPQPEPPYMATLDEIGLRVHLSGGETRAPLTWEQLKKYPLLVMHNFTRLHGGHAIYGEEALGDLLDRYLNEGGSILLLGTEQMNNLENHEEINRWLARHGAQWIWGTVDDEKHRYENPPRTPFNRPEIIWTSNITDHPAMNGVNNLFFRNFVLYVPYLRPLKVSGEWTTLVKSMPGSTLVDVEGGSLVPKRLEDTRRPGPANLLAVRQVGKGRLAVMPYTCGQAWFDIGKPAQGAIGWREGDGERKSDWLPMLRSLALWLTEPARQAGFPGGATGTQEFTIKPDWGTRLPIDWEKPEMAWRDDDVNRLHSVHSSVWTTADWRNLLAGNYPSFKILVGARTVLSGGKGSVADWKKAAKAAGFDGVAFREDILKLSEEQWNSFVEECLAANDDSFIAFPGQQFQTMDGSRFMRFNKTIPYHLRKRLNEKGDRVLHQLHFYFDSGNSGPTDWRSLPANFPLTVKNNPAPWWSYRVYDALPVRIYENGKLIEDNLDTWRKLVSRFEFPTPIALHLLDDPAQVAATANLPHLRLIAPNMKTLQTDHRWSRKGMGLGHPFNTVGYLSDGPEIQAFQALHPYRTTLGSRQVEGSYRYRFYIRARSDRPIKRVELISDGEIVRVFHPDRQEVYYEVDGLHDRQRSLYLRVVDADGREALASSVSIHDKMMYLQWCADHCNMLGAGMSVTKDGQPAKFGVATHVKLQLSTSNGPGASAADEVNYIPFGTDTASPTLNTKGTFQIFTTDGLLPAPGYDLIPDLLQSYGNRNVRVHRQVAQLQADRNYWINLQPNGERRIGLTYFSAWCGYFNMIPFSPFTLTVDDIDFQRDGWQPAFQWTRGEATVHEPIVLDGKTPIQVMLGNQQKQTDTFQVPGQTVDAKAPGTIRRVLKRGEWLSFSGQMGNGSLVPLLDGFAVEATVNPKGGSYLKFGLAQGEKTLAPGDTLTYSFLIMRWPTGMPLSERLEEKVIRQLGLGGTTGYQLAMHKGTVKSEGFGLIGTLDNGVWLAELPKGELSMRLPLRIAGVNPHWSAGVMRQGSTFFEPLAPDESGVVWASCDTVGDAGRFFFGHPVVADCNEIVLQTLQRTDGGWTVIAHNPGDTPVKVGLTGTMEGPLKGFAQSATLAPGEEKRWFVNAQPHSWEVGQ